MYFKDLYENISTSALKMFYYHSIFPGIIIEATSK